MLKVPNIGELELLDWLRLGFNANSPQCSLNLYKNDKTPADADVLASYTVCDFSGYAAVSSLTSWGAVFAESGKAKSVEASHQFTHDGGGTPNDVYGYFVKSETSGELLWAERFPSAPIVMDGLGDVIFVTPTLTLSTEA